MDLFTYKDKDTEFDAQCHDEPGALRPALASINAARQYMGNPSRAKFYADLLPLLETVKFRDTDKRRWVVVASMDRLIEARRASPPEKPAVAADASVQTATHAARDRQLPDADAAAYESVREDNVAGSRGKA